MCAETAGPQRSPSSRIPALCIGAAAFAVFARTIFFDFVYDDEGQVLGNPWIWNPRFLPNLLTKAVWSFKGSAPSNYYRPVQMVLYFLVAQISGRRPLGFHLASVLVHVLASVAAFYMLCRMTSARRAALAALLFAVYPAHVESVGWIAGSTDVNCALLTFAALIVWSREREASGRRRLALAALWGVLFFLALWAKEIAVVVPLLTLLLPRPSGAGGRGRPPRLPPWLREAAPIAALSFVALGLYLVLRLRALGGMSPLVRHGDLGPIRLVACGLALIPRYLLVAFFPWRPVPDRVFVPATGLLDPWAVAGGLILLGALALGARLRHASPAAAFGIGLLLLPLLPVLQVQYVGSNVQTDRYLYIPSLGVCLLLAESAARIRHRRPAARRAVIGACTLVVLLAAARTVTASSIWSDDETLARAGIVLEPRSLNMRMLLASTLDKAGRVEEGYRVAEAAVALDPTDRGARAYLTGFRAQRSGTPEGEIEIYRSALSSDPYQPAMWASLSAAYMHAKLFKQAVAAGEKALAMDPSNLEGIVNLASARGALGDYPGQEREARRAIDLDAASALGWLNLAFARLAQRDAGGAGEAALRAADLDPRLGRARSCLSYIAWSRGEIEEALREAERSVQLDPNDARLWDWLGTVRERRGGREEARDAWEQALALDPGDATASRGLQRLGASPSSGSRTSPAMAPPGG